MTSLHAALLSLSLDRAAPAPLHQQLTEGLRTLILSGRAAPGARLPSSRQLAQELSVSRITTLTALDQLLAEGYLDTRQGAGTFVALDLPRPTPVSGGLPPAPDPKGPQPYAPLSPAVPDMAGFPHADWARHLERAWRRPAPALLARPDPFGWPALREAIAQHLEAWRGLQCSAGQVIVTSGASETFDVIARALFTPGQRVAVEEPGFAPMRHALQAAGLLPVAVPVDADGMDIAQLPLDVAGTVVTPSRNYPLGMTLPLPRRLALIEHARTTGTWVIEDDYDSEFRYQGQPLPALASLSYGGQVIYVGSFSKLLSPALRLGYLVAPPDALPRLAAQIDRTGPRASLIPQPALAAFIDSGGFATHLRRMRRLYAERQRALIAALAPLSDMLEITPDPAGMHLVCPLRPGATRATDRQIVAQAQAAGLGLRALSAYFQQPESAPQGLVIGYAGSPPDDLSRAIATLTPILRSA